jgi:hypothetical protein
MLPTYVKTSKESKNDIENVIALSILNLAIEFVRSYSETQARNIIAIFRCSRPVTGKCLIDLLLLSTYVKRSKKSKNDN